MSEPSRQSLQPIASRVEVFSVAELIADVLAGRIRIPDFQRGWKWKREQILALLDSVYRGFPIGSLYFWQHAQPAERFFVGPREIVAPERSDARVVIDGQQRLIALSGALAHPDPKRDDDFVVFFDPSQGQFFSRPRPEVSIPEFWVPAARLLDPPGLRDWLLERPWFQDNEDLRQRVLVAGRQLRDARISTYIFEAGSEEIPREIFLRVNTGGRPMKEKEVFDSLASRRPLPGKIDDLENEVAALGMGKTELRRIILLQCVRAVAGLDVTRHLDDRSVTDELQAALPATAPALRSALVFLESEARIPHLRLLPCPEPLIVLTRYFHLFPEPSARSRHLLVRWIWRGMLVEHPDRKALRTAVGAVRSAEEEPSVQRLLELVPRTPPVCSWWLDKRFDGSSAASRIAGLGLASLEPRNLESGAKIDIKRLLDESGNEAFRLLPNANRETASASAAARLLHPKGLQARRLADLAKAADSDSRAILSSHAFGEEAYAILREQRWMEVIAQRRESLRSALERLAKKLAGWGKPDRPSIAYLLSLGKDGDSAA